MLQYFSYDSKDIAPPEALPLTIVTLLFVNKLFVINAECFRFSAPPYFAELSVKMLILWNLSLMIKLLMAAVIYYAT